jgi:capsular exopolysaccharide synthesis family protein
LNGKLMAARADTAEKRAKYMQAREVEARNGNLQAIPDVVRSQVVSSLRTQQAEVARREAELKARYNEQHPLVINAHAERRDIDHSITNEVSRIIANLSNDYDVANAREQSLQAIINEVAGTSGVNSDVGIRLRELERAAASNRLIYDSFLSRARITTEQSSLQEREARLITPAIPAEHVSFPKYPLTLALAAFVGLLLGGGAGLGLDMLNAGFVSARDIEEKLGISVLASVPMLTARDQEWGEALLDPTRLLIVRPLSRYAEAIRSIRVGIQMSDIEHPAKVILVTSCVPGEGKSTLATSLAYSAIKAGLKVLIIDGDLRHSSISSYFSLQQKPGLVELLIGSATLADCMRSAQDLSILPAGTKSQSPPDLLGSERMLQLIETVRADFDYIVIDSPPMLPMIDARILATLSDKIVFVVEWQSTTRELVMRTIDSIVGDQKIAGIVLNLVDDRKVPRYGPYSQHEATYYSSYYKS